MCLSLPKTQSGVGRRGLPSGERDGSFDRNEESVRMARSGACSLGVDIAGGNGSMQMDGAVPQAQQQAVTSGHRIHYTRDVRLAPQAARRYS